MARLPQKLIKRVTNCVDTRNFLTREQAAVLSTVVDPAESNAVLMKENTKGKIQQPNWKLLDASEILLHSRGWKATRA